MHGFRLSRAAVRDLLSIGTYTRDRWGAEKCRDYLARLDGRFKILAKRPDSGRECEELRTGYWYFREGRHVIFYRLRKRKAGVDIIRVLHERMLPERHL